MKRQSLIVFLVACFDIALLAVALSHGFADRACFVSRKAQIMHTPSTSYSWYVMPRTDGLQPEEQKEFAFIKDFDGTWIGDPDDKVIYLTFDAGYENGNTAQILDTLKKHDVPAAFFLVSHYITSAPELTRRMVSEGHLVCNHTKKHKDMSAISDFETFKAEIEGLENVYHELTGQQLPKYFRPPEGRFSETCLRYAQQLGYQTFFWSFAYNDWQNDSQPAEQDAIKTIIGRTHPGMVVLLHSTSSTNAKVLDDVITQWKAMGYRLESLDQFKAAP